MSPRLRDVAEGISADSEEAAECLKLFLPAGEIDVVVGQSLTAAPYETVSYRGRQIRVETSAEIIAKKMWHRGDRAKARDLFDLCAVADAEPDQIQRAAPFMRRHGAGFLQILGERRDQLRREFAQIDAIGPGLDFEHCLVQADTILRSVLAEQ